MRDMDELYDFWLGSVMCIMLEEIIEVLSYASRQKLLG
jgi:hypothetical protein